MKRKRTTHLVLHCADTPNGNGDYTIDDIRDWHVNENGWLNVGYQQVIHIDGSHIEGRPIDDVGAHCRGLNSRSVGICLIGRDRFTKAQWHCLRSMVTWLQEKYPDAITIGHNERSKKLCPGFSVQRWLENGMVPCSEHIFTR